MIEESTIKRFKSKVNIAGPDECWEWTGAIKLEGYGCLSAGRNKSPYNAHRLSYEIAYGEIPKGKLIMHSCDNRKCVNPNHLSIGTYKDNMIDMMDKGRGNGQFEKGNKRHPDAGRKRSYSIYIKGRAYDEVCCNYCGNPFLKRIDLKKEFHYCCRDHAMKHIGIRRRNANKKD